MSDSRRFIPLILKYSKGEVDYFYKHVGIDDTYFQCAAVPELLLVGILG